MIVEHRCSNDFIAIDGLIWRTINSYIPRWNCDISRTQIQEDEISFSYSVSARGLKTIDIGRFTLCICLEEIKGSEEYSLDIDFTTENISKIKYYNFRQYRFENEEGVSHTLKIIPKIMSFDPYLGVEGLKKKVLKLRDKVSASGEKGYTDEAIGNESKGEGFRHDYE